MTMPRKYFTEEEKKAARIGWRKTHRLKNRCKINANNRARYWRNKGIESEDYVMPRDEKQCVVHHSNISQAPMGKTHKLINAILNNEIKYLRT